VIRISEHDSDASNDSLGICPFQKTKCIAYKCHLWNGKLEESGEFSVGNCVFIKTLDEQKSIDRTLNWILTIIITFLILSIILVVIGATIP